MKCLNHVTRSSQCRPIALIAALVGLALGGISSSWAVAPQDAGESYLVTGTLPDGFEPRGGAKGEVVFFQAKGNVPLARRELCTDDKGDFQVSLPASDTVKGGLRAEVRVYSETFIPLCANGPVASGKALGVSFPKPVSKRDAVHYTGVFVDDTGSQPVPYVGVYRDANSGIVLGRADESGRFDFYAESRGGGTSFLPWLYGGEYSGHSFFFQHKAGESVEMKLIVERGAKMRVHAEDPAGAPLAGVYVKWMGAGGGGGTTDEHGDAVLSGGLSRVRKGMLTQVTKKGYELVENPGPLLASQYTNQPLRLVLRPVAEPTAPTGATAINSNSGAATGRVMHAGRSSGLADLHARQRKQLEERYQDFLEELHLPAASTNQFLDLITERQMAERLLVVLPRMGAESQPSGGTKFPSDSLRERGEQVDRQLKELLGEENFLRLPGYEQSIPWRQELREFKEKTAGAEGGLSSDLEARLLSTVLEERGRTSPPSTPAGPREPFPVRSARTREADERIMARMQSSLNPAQQKALADFFKEKRQAQQVASGVLVESVASVAATNAPPAVPPEQGATVLPK